MINRHKLAGRFIPSKAKGMADLGGEFITDEGIKELNIVAEKAAEFKEKTYDAFLNHKFKK